MNERWDAVVIGGGPAGSTAALLLARAGWSVALVERKAFPRRKVCGEYLSATNLPLFDHLGVGGLFREMAGPPVKQVGLFAGQAMLSAELPREHGEWGRALAREHLDTWLLKEAQTAGVTVLQPWSVAALSTHDAEHHCDAIHAETLERMSLPASIVIAAHGSWEAGSLPTQVARTPPLPSDLLGFKAHFLGSTLPAGLMPLLAFPGGYGGMVHCEAERVSLSCCIRRDQLTTIRARHGGDAGDAVLAHIQESCAGVRAALASARRDGAWLAAGPIRPGVRLACSGGIFPVGNAAGESHPAIAEGISMAMQSAWLLTNRLIEWRRNGRPDLNEVGDRYARAWRRAFLPRLQASRLLAQWAMRPFAVSPVLPVLRAAPMLLTWFARLSGKATPAVR